MHGRLRQIHVRDYLRRIAFYVTLLLHLREENPVPVFFTEY
jgi:hypothetical protein